MTPDPDRQAGRPDRDMALSAPTSLSEPQYRTALQHAVRPIFVLDDAGTVLDANEAAAAFAGRDRPGLVGRPLDELFGTEQGGSAGPRSLSEGTTFDATCTVEGRERILELSLTRADRDGLAVLLGVGRDVTEQRMAEHRVRHLNAVLRAIRNVNQLICEERDPRRLVSGVCDNLIETRGYLAAAVALTDGSGELGGMSFAEQGQEASRPVQARTAFPSGWSDALADGQVRAVDPNDSAYAMPGDRAPRGSTLLLTRLEHGGKVFGTLAVLIAAEMAHSQEERELFLEVACDIALALHGIELDQARRRTENELRKSERRFRTLVSNLPGAVFRTANDAQFTLQYISEGIEAISGHPAEELIRRRAYTTIMHPDDCEHVRRVIDEHVAQGSGYAVEYRVVARDGRVRWVYERGQAVPTDDGRDSHLDGVIVDVTELKRAEEELRASEEKFRSLFESMNEGVVLHELMHDAAGRAVNYVVVDVNAAAERLIGRRREEMIDRTVTDVFGVAEPPFLDVYCRVASTGEPTCFSTFFRPLGRYYRVSAFCPARGQVATVIEDITTLVETQKENVRLSEQLHHAQKMEAVGQLAGGMAHDFNNLLTVVLGHLDLAETELPADHPVRASMATIKRAAQQGTGVTRSLLTFSRKYHAAKTPIDFCAGLCETSGLLQRVLPDGISLRVVADCSRPTWVEGDAAQLQQVLLNLAVNARDAMPDGGELTIEIRGPVREEAAGSDRTWAELVVRDTGTGIAPDNLSRVFEPFFTTKPRGQGTGLGLSIVHGIVKDHGGQVEVSSEPGSGTTFTIRLPCMDAPAGLPGMGPAGEIRALRGTILLAEDNEAIRKLIRRGMEDDDVQIIEAGDGESLMDLHRRHGGRINLMIVDIDLPRLSGLACLRDIRSMGDMTPAIIITGSTGADYESQPLPATVLLRKPFHMSELQAAASHLTSHRSTGS